MNGLSIMRRLAPLAIAGVGLALGACSKDYHGTSRLWHYYDDVAVSQAAPAPKAEEKPVKTASPAPAPAPAQPTGRCATYTPNAGPNFNTSMLAFPTGDVASSGLMVHNVMPKEVRLNQPFTYELHVTNVTNGTLQNVVVNHRSQENLNITASTPSFMRGNDGSMMWNVGDLGPCKTTVIKVTATAGKVGIASNCITASYNNALCAATTVVEPSLAISKIITPKALICEPVTMTVEVKNTGSGTATNVKVRDQLPANLTTADGKSVIEENVGTLAAGASKQYTYQLKAGKTGKYDNTAQAMADGGLTAQSQTVSTVISQPVLSVSCKAPERVLMNRDVTYEFTVKNTGDAACEPTLTASIPGGQNIRPEGGTASPTGATWNVGSLAPNASKTFKVTFRPTGAAGGTFKVSATASNCKCAANATTECGTAVQGVPDIGTLVDDEDGVVTVGDPHTYRVQVMNQGQVNLTNVKMVVSLPEGMSFVSSADGKLVGNKVEFTFGTLAPGAKKMSTFVVKSSKSGELLVIGETTCSELKTPVRDDELTNFIDR